MVKIHRRLRDEGRASRLVLQVHDELLVEAPDAEVSTVKELVRDGDVRRLSARPAARRRRRRRRRLERSEVALSASGSESGNRARRPAGALRSAAAPASSSAASSSSSSRGTSTVTRTGERAVDESASVSSPSRTSAVSSRYSSRPSRSFAPWNEAARRPPEPLREHGGIVAGNVHGRLAAAWSERRRPHRVAASRRSWRRTATDTESGLADRIALFHQLRVSRAQA